MAKKRGAPPIVYILIAAVFGVGGYLFWKNQVRPELQEPPTARERPASPNEREAVTELRILGDTFSGYSTFRDGEFQKTLAESGIQLQYANEFDQAKRAEALTQGRAELMVTTLDRFLQQSPSGKIVALIDRTIGADAVVLNSLKYPELKSINDLDRLAATQKAQGVEPIATYAGDTPSEYLALVLDTKFEAFNLSSFRIQKVADASEAWELLQTPDRAVALAILWEPYVTQARQKGYSVVLSSQDAPKSIVDVLVASNDAIASRPDAIATTIEAYYRHIDANARDASRLQAQIATDGNLSESEAASIIDGIDFFTAVEAERWFEDGTLDRRINSTAAVLTLAGRLNAVPDDPSTLYETDFIDRAARNSETLIELIRADNPELAERLSGQAKSITPTLTPQQIQAAPDIGNLNVRGEVKFAANSADLTGESQTTLDRLTSEIDEFSAQTVAIRVIGHTSRSGSAEFNQTLSRERAQVVVDFLKSKGLSHNFLAEGQGFDRPIAGLDPADPKNQRTEIRLVRAN